MAGLLPVASFVPALEPTLWANAHHNAQLDTFFRYYTQVAEWPVVVVALLMAFVRHWKTGVWVSICYGIEALTVNALKLFFNQPRPRLEAGIDNLHQIAGETIHSYHSFPSGHTAAAFIGFGFISYMYPNRYFQMICIFMAALVAYSRLYLGQHYLRDTLAGGFIALFILLFYAYTHDHFHKLTRKRVR